MVFLDDLKEMTLYKKPFVLPIDEENIRKGSAIFLVSPNAETSKEMMNYPYMINKMNTFNGYYLEKNANYYINQEGNLIPIDRDDEYIHEVSEEELEPINEVSDGLLAFAVIVLPTVAAIIDTAKRANPDRYNKSTEYYVSTSKGGKPAVARCSKPEISVLAYAYSKGIRSGEDHTIFIDDSNSNFLDDTLYVYKDSGFGKMAIANGTLKSLLTKYHISVKEVDKSSSKEREEAFKKALSLLRSNLPSNIKSKGKFYNQSNNYDKEVHDNFIDGVSNNATIFYASLWDIDKEARTHEMNNENADTIWNPLSRCSKEVSNKLPKGYTISYDRGDWDDILISIEYSKSQAAKESVELEEGFFGGKKTQSSSNDSDYSDFLHKNYATESEWKAKYRSDFIATYKACIRKAESIGKLLMNGEAVKNGLFSYPDLHDDWPSSEMIKYMDKYEGGPNDRKSGICLKSLVVVETDFSGYSPKSSVDAILDKIEKDLNDCIPTKYKDESQKMFFRIKRFNGGNFMLIANSIIMHESVSYGRETTGITESEEELEEASKDITVYRVTCNGEGVYEALRKSCSADEWKKILASDACTWLPKPPEYGDNSRSYFTPAGYKVFSVKTLPVIEKYLGKGKINIEKKTVSMEDPFYSDRYQVVVNEDAILEKYTYYNNKKYKKVPKSAKLYHGSRTQNLKELTPKNDSVSRVGNATAVYASKDKRFAACYGTAWRDDIAKQGTWDKWNTVIMGISDKVVMDKPCSLYELENDGSFIEISDKEVISLNTIKVKKEHKYSSYAEMLKQNGVKVISYDEYIKNVKSPNPEFHYLNEAGIDADGFEYSNSFSDVMKVVNSLPKKDLLRICNGRFKDSPYVIYREVLSVSGSPVAFIDVYKLPNMEEDGCIVLATNPKWRGKGLASTLVERMKHTIGDKNLVWKTQLDNHASLAIAKSNGYSPVFSEATLSSKERNELSDSDFGIPSLRKYPLTDAQHVKSAIRFFNYVDSEHEAELAKNIKRKAIEFKVPIRCGEGNRLSKYITEEYVQEFMSVVSIGNDMTAVCNGTIRQHMSQGDMVYSFDHQKPYTKKKRKPVTEVFTNDIYFISERKLDGARLSPRVPSNYMTKNGYEDSTTPRICMSRSIEGCLRAMSANIEGKTFYVYTPSKEVNVYEPALSQVPDCAVTHEVWVKEDVILKCIGTIEVGKATKPIEYTYGDAKKAELWDWEYKFHGLNESGDEPEDVFFDDMIKDIEKFCNEEPEPFPTDVLNEKKGSH